VGDALVAGEEAVFAKELLCACCVRVETCGEGLCKVCCADAVRVFCCGRCVGRKVVFEDVHALVALRGGSAWIGGAGDTVIGHAVVDHVRTGEALRVPALGDGATHRGGASAVGIRYEFWMNARSSSLKPLRANIMQSRLKYLQRSKIKIQDGRKRENVAEEHFYWIDSLSLLINYDR
jgi:hypothetical protein